MTFAETNRVKWEPANRLPMKRHTASVTEGLFMLLFGIGALSVLFFVDFASYGLTFLILTLCALYCVAHGIFNLAHRWEIVITPEDVQFNRTGPLPKKFREPLHGYFALNAIITHPGGSPLPITYIYLCHATDAGKNIMFYSSNNPDALFASLTELQALLNTPLELLNDGEPIRPEEPRERKAS